MFGAVRGLFAADANDDSPEGPGPSSSASLPASSSSSDTQETQDVFEPLSASNEAPASAAGPSNLGNTDRRPARSNPKPLFQEDDGTDTGGPKRRRPLAQRQRFDLNENGRAIETRSACQTGQLDVRSCVLTWVRTHSMGARGCQRRLGGMRMACEWLEHRWCRAWLGAAWLAPPPRVRTCPLLSTASATSGVLMRLVATRGTLIEPRSF